MNKKIDARINKIIGQLESIKKISATDDYDCEKIILQIKAIMGSVRGLGKAFAENDIKKCVETGVSKKEQEAKLKVILDAAFKL